MIKYFITPNVLTVIVNGRQMFVPKSHLNYGTMCRILKEGCQDEKVIMDLFDLKQCMLVEFPEYVELDENGKLVMKYCHQINLDKFVKEVLTQQRDGACISGFFMLLMNMSQNNTVDTYSYLQFMKSSGWVFSPMGSILCYAKVFEENSCLICKKDKADAIISIHPKDIEFYRESGRLQCGTAINRNVVNVSVEWQGNNENIPELKDFNVFNGEEMLDCL